jgi:hypothetical protein
MNQHHIVVIKLTSTIQIESITGKHRQFMTISFSYLVPAIDSMKAMLRVLALK